MDTFPIVKRKDDAQHGEYRTKRVILEIYDAMQRAIDTGQPYQTLLDPPPGNGVERKAAQPANGAPAISLPVVAEKDHGTMPTSPAVETTRVEHSPKPVTAPATIAKPQARPTMQPKTRSSSARRTGSVGNTLQARFIDPPEAPSYRAGDTVRHSHFGEGKVLAIEPQGSDYIVTVAFKVADTRRLMAIVGKLEKIVAGVLSRSEHCVHAAARKAGDISGI